LSGKADKSNVVGMTRERFMEIGAALFGPLWQSEVARGLGISDRTVRRIVRGEAQVSDEWAVDLVALAVERMGEIGRLVIEEKVDE
jgi:plasmid maintenance system antidote protein VapI